MLYITEVLAQCSVKNKTLKCATQVKIHSSNTVGFIKKYYTINHIMNSNKTNVNNNASILTVTLSA